MREKEVKDKKRKLRQKLTNFETLEEVQKDKLRDIDWQKEVLANRKEETEQKISNIENTIEDLRREENNLRNKLRADMDENKRLDEQYEKVSRKKSDLNEKMRIANQEYHDVDVGENECELVEKLIDYLECPVCYDLVRAAPIYRCPNDHILCR